MGIVTRGDGGGLNPLLQYPEMVIPSSIPDTPASCPVPFCFALGALLGRYPGEKWIHITRRWTMIAPGDFKASAFCWARGRLCSVTGAATGCGTRWKTLRCCRGSPLRRVLHSVMMQEKRGMMRVWNVWLVFCTFLLTIFGTFLTRSGIVSSVHAFSQSKIGPWFLSFIGVIFAVCLVSFWRNRDYLRSDNKLDSLVSRESSFLFNNLILLVACVAVISGTLFPVLSEWVTVKNQRGRAFL